MTAGELSGGSVGGRQPAIRSDFFGVCLQVERCAVPPAEGRRVVAGGAQDQDGVWYNPDDGRSMTTTFQETANGRG